MWDHLKQDLKGLVLQSTSFRMIGHFVCQIFSLLPFLGFFVMLYLLLPQSWLLHDQVSTDPLRITRERQLPAYVQTSRKDPRFLRRSLHATDPQLFLRELGFHTQSSQEALGESSTPLSWLIFHESQHCLALFQELTLPM